jgi:lipoyl(octanoyl) transferase
MAIRGTLEVAWLGTVDYAAALALQDVMVAARRDNLIGDTLLLLEHPHVFTLGRGADERYLLRALSNVPMFRVSRGGQVTYHGPGQLIGYPILKLEGAERDVHRYLRGLEAAMIDALASMGIAAGRRAGLTGVWVEERKIGSIGVGIRRWITLHGFALNVCPRLEYFDAMVPCGIAGCEMTSVERERGAGSVREMAAVMRESFAAALNYQRTADADAAALWALVDRPGAACEARSQG